MRPHPVALALSAAALAILGGAPPAAFAQPKSDGFPPKAVGIVAMGPDDTAVGDLQRVLELRLNALPDVKVTGAAAIAERAGAPAALDAARLDAETAAIYDDVRHAYYRNQSVKALDRLAEMKALLDRSGVRDADRWAQLFVWRAAVLLALGEDGQAAAEAKAALRLAPDLEVDLRVFQPSVAREVQRVRDGMGKPVTVTLVDLPPGATVRVGDYAVPAGGAERSVLLFPGRQSLRVDAPGRRAWTREVDVRGPVTLRPSLGIALEAPFAEALSQSVWQGKVDAPVGRELSRVAGELSVDWVLVAATRMEPAPEVRGLLVSLRPQGEAVSRVFPLSTAPAAIADWAEETLRRPVVAAGSTAGSPLVNPPARTAPPPALPPRREPAPSRAPRIGGYGVIAAGALVPQESNYAEERVAPGGALLLMLGYQAPRGIAVEGGVHLSSVRVGPRQASVVEPFLALRIAPREFGGWTPSLSFGVSPWTVLSVDEPIELREGRTDILRGSSVDAGLGVRRALGQRWFLTGDLRYMAIRYQAATMDGSVSTGRALIGDQSSILLGAGIRF